MKTHEEVTLAVDGGVWSASCPCCFIPGEAAPCTHWTGSWVGPTASLDAMEKRKILPLSGIKPLPYTPSLLLYQLSYSINLCRKKIITIYTYMTYDMKRITSIKSLSQSNINVYCLILKNTYVYTFISAKIRS
jgi:hypothetical protein